MLYPIIDFNDNNEIIISRDIKQDRFAAFANREILNKWCGSNFCFQSDNGIGTENFYNKIPWCEVQGISPGKYYWGDEVIKKIKDKKYVSGCSPFAYSTFLYEDLHAERKYKTVFLPKSDYPYKTRLIETEDKIKEMVDLFKSLDDDDVIFIAFPFDWVYCYRYFLPEELLSKTYVLGYNGFDRSWIMRLKKVLLRSQYIHVPYIFSSNVAYATFLDIPIKFYHHDFYERGKIPDNDPHKNFHEFTSSMYTVVPSERDAKWNTFMNYLKDCFENNSDDKYWWTTKFLSLDKIKEPKYLYEDLNTLHQNFVSKVEAYKNVEISSFTKTHDLYEATKEKCDIIIERGKNPSKTAITYLQEI